MAILSDEFYYQPIRLDTINTRVYADLLAKEGDANGRGLLVTLTENGLMKDTTGITLNLKWEHTSVGNQGLDNFEVVDLSKGLYKITYPTEMLNRGNIRAFIQIIDSGKLAGTRNIEIAVDRGVGDDTAIASSDSFTALAQALIEVNNLEETYAPELLSVKQQLVDSESKRELISRKKRKVLLTFVDDDTKSTVMDRWPQIIQEKNIKMNLAVITGGIGETGSLTWQQIKDLKAMGAVPVVHCHNHIPYTTLTETELRTDIQTALSLFKANGLHSDALVYVGGAHNALVRKVTRDYFR